ncbi:ATP-binding protein [Streptomyces sp. MJP52]|uniref:sensor histidine kinase n=1 Tax=Streptomyces sp. MJP52 TaxID=2940555 RepID=UPI00247713E3|nr:ATP-binding protein [Streptomyces sp. MJP52]MDH6223408.1 signal transduction histidine kinase [Streptomyces sp. MJP52]
MPLSRVRSVAFVCALTSGALAGATAFAFPEDGSDALVWTVSGGGVLLTFTAGLAAWFRSRELRAVERYAELEADAVRFADTTLPAAIARAAGGATAERVLAEFSPTGRQAAVAPVRPEHARALQHVVRALGRSEARRAAALAACANAAGRMQAISTSTLAELREMEERHHDGDVLADLLHVDHRTAQAGRLADSIAVLSGARSGRRWARPITMESVLRGAMGRIAGYRRVRLRAVPPSIAVAGHAAEGVMHVLAELLDNACNFSPPSTEVFTYVSEVPAGLLVTVEDSGLTMGDSALRRAEQAVSGDAPDLSALTGTRLGLAVVGHLARKHDLTVSFRPSATGGTAVLVLIPRHLVSRVEETPAAPAATAAAGGAAPAAAAAPAPGHAAARRPASGPIPSQRTPSAAAPGQAGALPRRRPAGTGTPATGPGAAAASTLPKRRRGQTFAAAHPEGLPGAAGTADDGAPAPSSLPRPARHGARFHAFRTAVTGRADRAGQENATPRSSDPATAED